MAKRKQKTQNNLLENIYLIPIGLVLVLAPLVVRYHKYTKMAKVYRYGLEAFATESADFINWWKSVVILVAAVGMLGLLAYKLMSAEKDRWKWNVMLVPLGLYGLLTFLSACFSKYTYIAFHGMDGLFESVWILLAYCLCVVYTFYVVEGEHTVRKIIKIYGIGLSIISVFGLIELVFGNLLGTEFGKWLIYPISMVMEYGESLDLVKNLDQVFLTFYNSNYVGSYMAVTIPFTAGIFLAAEEKKEKIWFGILGVCQVILLIGSEARSGIYGMFVALVIFFLLYRNLFRKYWKKAIIGVGAVLVVAVAADGIMGFTMTKRILRSFSYMERNELELSAVETGTDCIALTYRGNEMEVVYNGYNSEEPFSVTSEGKEVSYTLNEKNVWETKDSRFVNIQLAQTGNENYDCFDIGVAGVGWRFIYTEENGGYYYVNYDNYPEKLEVAPKAFGREWYGFASGRGYIWAKTLPLLKNTVLLGTGPDTFFLEYPYNDYVSDRFYFESEVNRPHNLYLQIGVQTGVVSLVAFLIFVGIYLVSSFRLYWKAENSFLSTVGKGIMAGVAGYLTAGMVNDSIVGIAQIFWVLIGLGMAVNGLVKKQQKGSNENGK